MKFITTVDEDGDEELFIFPRNVHHDAMAEVLSRIRNQTHGNWQRVFRQPIAAGFVDFHRDQPTCFGESETLKLKSRPEDTQLIKKQLCAF